MFSEWLHRSKKPQERNSDRLNIGNSFVSPDNLWSVMYFYATTGCKETIFQKTYYPFWEDFCSLRQALWICLWNFCLSSGSFGAIPAERWAADQESRAAWRQKEVLAIAGERAEYYWKRLCETRLNWLTGESLHKVAQEDWSRRERAENACPMWTTNSASTSRKQEAAYSEGVGGHLKSALAAEK